MSKTGRINYRRGTRGTSKSERLFIAACVRREVAEQDTGSIQSTAKPSARTGRQHHGKSAANEEILKVGPTPRKVGHGHRQ